MNNKSILTIIIATLLALLCAFLIIKRDDAEAPVIDNDLNVQEEVAVPTEEQKEEIIEETEEKKVVNETKPVAKAPVVKPAVDVKKEQPVFERITVQEGGVVEEVEEDHGIRRNADGTYEITREFKMKSPTKYSFVDFGFLEKVSK